MARPARSLAILLAALAAAPLSAQDAGNSATRTVRVYGESAPACVVSAATASQGSVNAAFTPDGNGGGTIAIGQLVDPDTAEPRASSIDIDLPVRCNSAHRLTVTSSQGGLLRAGGVPTNKLSEGGFADLLPYRIGIDWAGTSNAIESDNGPALASSQSAANGDLHVHVATAPGGGALVAGNYADAIVIRFEPAS